MDTIITATELSRNLSERLILEANRKLTRRETEGKNVIREELLVPAD